MTPLKSIYGTKITYYTVIRAFAVRRGSTLTGPQDLAGRTVIVTKDSTADQDIQQQIRQHHVKGVTVRYTDNEGAAVKMVSQGKVFAYGGGLGSIQYQAKRFRNIKVAWPHRILVPGAQRGHRTDRGTQRLHRREQVALRQVAARAHPQPLRGIRAGSRVATPRPCARPDLVPSRSS